MPPLNRKLLRDLWHVRGLVIAIALVIGAGYCNIRHVAQHRAGRWRKHATPITNDIVLRMSSALPNGAPERLVPRIAGIQGVRAVDTRIVRDVTLDMANFDEPVTGRLVSIPESGLIGLKRHSHPPGPAGCAGPTG